MTRRDDDTPTVEARPGREIRAPVPAVGATLERFREIREIARGGMGRVVEAFDRHLGRTVAVKQSLDDDPATRLRFEREVAITARLEHPSIVPVYDAGVLPSGEPFYVMRKVTGVPLDRLIRDAVTLDQRLVLLPNVLAVADAVAHAHQRGVIHRDLKPSNVLVGELGETVVIDWGLAKVIGEMDVVDARDTSSTSPLHTAAGAVFGTPGFMAPEQVSGGATDARTDVYALGACLYYVLAGRPPHHGSTEQEVFARTLEGRLDRIEDLVPGVPSELVTIIDQAMARDPERRYLDAGGLGEELRRFLAGQLVASHRYSPRQRLARWARRHRAVIASAALGLTITVAVATILLRRVFDEQARTEAALRSERDRADDLVVAQAAAHLEADPTRALATLRLLPEDSPRWANVAVLVAQARVRGVAVGYPGNGEYTEVKIAPGRDDRRMLSSGGGRVLVHDLATHRSTTVVSGSPGVRGWWCGALVVITNRLQGAMEVVDLRSAVRVVVPSPAEYLSTVPGTIAWAERDGHVATLEVDTLPITSSAITVEGALAPTWIKLSPSGTWLVVGDRHHTQLFRRLTRGGEWQLAKLLDHPVDKLAFDPLETRLAISDDSSSQVLELDLARLVEVRRWDAKAESLTYADRGLFALVLDSGMRFDYGEAATQEGRGRVVWLGDNSEAVHHVFVPRFLGAPVVSLGGPLATLESPRRIVITHRNTRHVVRAPEELTDIVADAHGRYLAGSSRSTILVWDLAQILPERATIQFGNRLAFADDTTLLARGPGSSGETRVARHVLRTHPFGVTATETLPPLPGPAEIGVRGTAITAWTPDGMTVLAPPTVSNIRDATEISAIDHEHLLVGDRRGGIERVELATGATHRVAMLDGRIDALGAAGGWSAALTSRMTLWRRDPDGLESTSGTREACVKLLALSRNGTVYLGCESGNLLAWPPTSAAPSVIAELGLPIREFRIVTGDHVAVVTSDGTLHVIDPLTRRTRSLVRSTGLAIFAWFAFSADGTTAATQTEGGIVAIDLASGRSWTLVDELTGFADLALSPDGRLLVAINDNGRLHRFSTARPAASRTSVLAMTNALPPRSGVGPLEWDAVGETRVTAP